MNRLDEQSLMAYVDGELDATQRAAVERALSADETLRARVAALHSQRHRVSAAFAGVLNESVPQRLTGLLANVAAPSDAIPAAVVNLGEARAVRAQRRSIVPGWAQWGGMAASVVLGVLLGVQFSGRGDDVSLDLHDGHLVALGPLGQALSTQLASTRGAPVAVQLSFVDRAGAYCRTFSTAAIAGLACRRDGHWDVQTLAAAESAADGVMHPAASSLPRAVLDAVDQHIAGDALDTASERRARDQGWQR